MLLDALQMYKKKGPVPKISVCKQTDRLEKGEQKGICI